MRAIRLPAVAIAQSVALDRSIAIGSPREIQWIGSEFEVGTIKPEFPDLKKSPKLTGFELPGVKETGCETTDNEIDLLLRSLS